MSEKPTRARRSPQEKKRLSYERDRVNTYGQNDKASRSAIRRNKRIDERTLRRATKPLIKKIARAEDDTVNSDTRVSVATSKKLRHGRWRKIQDCPIGVLLDNRPMKRSDGADRKRTRNVRDSVQAIAAIVSRHEQQSYLWLKGVHPKQEKK
jgi:hypothetical protein